MANYAVIKVENAVLQKMETHYQKFITSKTPQYAKFAAKKNGVMITAYNSGKVMFQGAAAEQEAALWGIAETASKTKQAAKPAAKNQNAAHLPTDFASWSVLGSDEVGNGSYFGPVVVAAVYAAKENLPLLRELGVKDSKMLTDDTIIRIAKDIEVAVPHKVLVVEPEKYNQVQPKYNAVHMKVVLHNQAICLLLSEIAPAKPQGILIDQFTPENNFKKYVAAEPRQISQKIYFATKGEQEHLAVAAASILCRARFLAELAKESQTAGITIPSGAGKTADLAAAKLLKRGGLPLLKKYAKLHFANTQKAQKLAGKGNPS